MAGHGMVAAVGQAAAGCAELGFNKIFPELKVRLVGQSSGELMGMVHC